MEGVYEGLDCSTADVGAGNRHSRGERCTHLQRAEFGACPSDVEGLLKAWAEPMLKDSDSARYVHVSKPRKEWAVEQRQPICGWAVCATINAKKSYGSYTGAQA